MKLPLSLAPVSPALLSLALALACTTAAAQTTPQNTAQTTTQNTQQAGTMKVIVGDVRVSGANAQDRKLQPGDRIEASQTVHTGTSSAASMVLRDGTIMSLGPASQLDLRRFQYDSTTQQGNVVLSLLKGSMRMITGLIGKNNHDAVSLTARTTTIGIRGTDFIVSLDEGDE